ncbi:MAG: LptF/LptG family permease, partial [Chitinophagaceae bacterium]|nr:LptF/LptG family permease [Chitinophagaceae bacterium]
MKKLDILILKSFLGPFIVTFFIALFVLMMQILWKYIDDLVGKGLDFITIMQFIWYASASLF